MATPECTEKYFQRLVHQRIPGHAVRILGRTGLQISSIGFGGYRIHHNSIEHARALRYALGNGINLIDTSSNYTDGGSEMLIGNLLQEMIERGELQREEVAVVSKVGYVQGQNLKLAQENEAFGHPFPEMVKYQDGCWHCIHPDFLQDQLSRTLERLHLPALDVYLLHNPEYFLSDIKNHGDLDLETAKSEYYRRIQSAFEWMEEKVSEGKIRAYGISSNTFPLPAADFEFTSLQRVIEIAEYVASSHYFQVIQFPFNLLEAGACLEKNQSEGTRTLLEWTVDKEIATLVNRPLNAMTRSGMVRLADFRKSDAQQVENEFRKGLKALSDLEQQFSQTFISKVTTDIPREQLQQVFSMAKLLKNSLRDFQNWQHWDHVKQNLIVPQTSSHLNYLDYELRDDPAWKQWSRSYTDTLSDFLDTVSKHYENRARQTSHYISQKLDALSLTLTSSDTLSQKALRLLTSVTGVHCVLLGMRKVRYVEDALAALKQGPVENAEHLLSRFDSLLNGKNGGARSPSR